MRRLLLAALLALAAGATPARAGVLVDVIADGSQNMWRQTRGVYRITILRNGVRAAHAALPEGVELGVRAWGVEDDVGRSRRLLPIGRHSRDAVKNAMTLMNPRGRVELVTAVREAAEDFEGREGRRVAVVIATASDEVFRDACAQLQGAGERLGAPIHVLGLDVESERDREELKCIATGGGGAYRDVRTSDALASGVRLILKDAIAQMEREEAEKRAEAERARLMADKTRLRVRFANQIDPFFADEVRLVECALDGEAVAIDPAKAAAGRGEPAVVLDEPVPEGKHVLRLRYVKTRAGRPAESEAGETELQVQRGRTTDVLVGARGGLARWKVAFETEILAEGEGG